MEAENFIARWKDSELIERTAAQQHLIDQCRILGKSARLPTGKSYTYFLGIKVGEEMGRAI